MKRNSLCKDCGKEYQGTKLTNYCGGCLHKIKQKNGHNMVKKMQEKGCIGKCKSQKEAEVARIVYALAAVFCFVASVVWVINH